ncbi:MAG: hypothetical protein IJG57_00960 [Firmicutes bacterium]|nr:hypothetical protein [Bacillota bacterium]
MKIQKKRLWVLLLAAALVLMLSLAAGCTSSSEVPDEDVPEAASEPAAEPAEPAAEEPAAKEEVKADPYDAVLAHYYEQATTGWTSPEFEGQTVSYMFYEFPYLDPAGPKDIGYAFVDIDKDGQKELLVSRLIPEGDLSVVYDLFTVVNGKAVHIASSGERYQFWLCEDDTLTYYGSGGASDSYQAHYTLKNGYLWMLEFIHSTDQLFEGVYVPYYGKDLDTREYEKAAAEGKEAEEAYTHENMKAISQTEADQIVDSWPENKDIQLTSLADFKGTAQ